MVGNSDRSVLQGYFLNVSNPSRFSRRIRLRFNATTPQINPAEVLAIRDTIGNNVFGGLVANSPTQLTYDFALDAGDTGLVILQPDITTLDPTTADVEVRGYVEIFVLEFLPTNATRPLLLTPEHRGTFLPSPNGSEEFDQLVVALPTSTGAALMNIEVMSTIVFPGPIPTPTPLPDPALPMLPMDATANGLEQTMTLPQILNVMADRISTLETQLTSSEA